MNRHINVSIAAKKRKIENEEGIDTVKCFRLSVKAS